MKTVEEAFSEWGNTAKEPATDYSNIEGRLWRAFRAGYAAAKAEAPQWEGIESAPKDGTHILVCTAGSGYYAVSVHWFDNDWIESMTWDGEPVILKNPTHWIGIPPIPEAKP